MTDRGTGAVGREDFQASLERGDVAAASAAVRLLLQSDGGSSVCSFIRRALESNGQIWSTLPRLRVALLSSFSSEFLHDPIMCYGFANGVRVEIYQAGFGQYRQEILDTGSGLYRWQPDVVILAVEGEDWIPELYTGFLSIEDSRREALVGETQTTMESLIRTFRIQSSAVMLVHSLMPPIRRSLGILDGHRGVGQGEFISKINKRLSDLTKEIMSLYVVDYVGLVTRIGASQWYDSRMAHYAKAPLSRQSLGYLAAEYAKFFRALTGKSKKCLVVDLDNTLWGGVVGEEGPLGVKLGATYPGSAFLEFQRELMNLRKRGVILAVASKNNESDVQALFETNKQMVLSRDDFSAWKVNWNRKSQSIREIAKELNIGFEHIVFVDDNRAECDEVSSALPMVTVISLPKQPERYRELVLEDGLFDTLSRSEEDLRRGALYRQRDEAEALRAESKTLEDFYRGLDMIVTFAPVCDESLPRAAQLTQKTNQFNVTTIRYGEAELTERRKDPSWVLTTVQVRDRFGDNGIVGFMMARLSGGRVEIDTFLLSCRVIGRTVETAMLAYLLALAKEKRLGEMRGRFVPTAKNAPARDIYERHGFVKIAEDESSSQWLLRVDGASLVYPAWLKIVESDPILLRR